MLFLSCAGANFLRMLRQVALSVDEAVLSHSAIASVLNAAQVWSGVSSQSCIQILIHVLTSVRVA
jgi:hypothetical protein